MSTKTSHHVLPRRAALSLSAASSIFLWVPLYVTHLSINDLNFNILDFIFSCVVATLVAGTGFFALTSLLSRLRLEWLGSALLYFLLFWSCIAGFMLPLVKQAGMVSPENLVTAPDNVAIVAGVSLLLTLLTFTRLKPATQIFLLILTITTAGSALPSLMFNGSASPERFARLSDSDNLIVLSFDGLAGNVAKDVFEHDPQLREQLKDFVFYANAVAPAPATWASVRAEVYGNIDYRTMTDEQGNTVPGLEQQVNSIQREQNNASDVVTYGIYSAFNTEPADRIIPLTLGSGPLAERAATALTLYPYIAARIGTAHAAAFVNRRIAELNRARPLDTKAQRLLEHQGDKWDALNTLHNADLVAFTDELHVDGSRRSVRYLHLLHTHFPVDLDENCTYRSDDKTWFDRNQNYQGLFNETHCALRQTASLVEKLKTLGVYDKTTFVVKSDHGAPVPYLNSEPDMYAVNNHAMWGYNRYRPLLMIKTRSHASDSLTYNGMVASLSDLARTLCLQAPGKQSCDNYSGLDILDPTTATQEGIAYLDVVKDENSTFAFDTQMTIAVPRNPDFTAALESTGKVVLSNEPKRFDQRKRDLAQVNAALQAYHQRYGSYPVSEGLDGINSAWGKNSDVWISGLVPDFIPELPRDPAQSPDNIPQYLYQSDGKDYKLIAHGTLPSCTYAARTNPELVDPRRNCWAFGYWSDGARTW